ncbi:MAG: transcription termination/antitermination protein NusA [Ruminococcaceae bacterium]|nr:transcription termination/antitermination protein NusA [Oscillospiraceae bacterium]
MNKEFFLALDMLEKEKGIPKEYMLEKIEAALLSACKKEYGPSTMVRVLVDPVKEDLKVYIQKEVVEEVTNPQCQISLEDAKAISRRYTLGKLVETEVKTKNVRRLSASAAKSVIIQGIREGERKVMQDAYESKRGEIITATVSKVFSDNGNVLVDTGNGFATLLKSEQIPGEVFTVGDKVKVFVMEVNKDLKGPLVTLSRVHSGLVRRMFELEIPEIQDGIVMVKGVSREAGSRTKIAVWSRDEDVDAVGACIGNHGMRIQEIVKELRGEKIDIVKYSEDPAEYVAASLAPADVKSVDFIDERSCRVVVDNDQLSLAIGKEGQNARLAARLTGMKIDIKAE